MEYITSSEAAEKWGITKRRVNILCSQGRIAGAEKKGNIWLLPMTSKRPKDNRCINNTLEIHMVCKSTEALGPYKRYGLWLQGCDKKCKGCISPESQKVGGGYERTVDELMQDISSQLGIEGVTISGGEPFLQAKALEKLLVKIKEKKDLGVIIYTGYCLGQLKEITKTNPEVGAVLAMTDILIDGEYIEELNDEKSLRGSSNQNVLFLTDRYKAVAKNYYGLSNRKTEWVIGSKQMQLIGIPDKKTAELFSKKLRGDSE